MNKNISQDAYAAAGVDIKAGQEAVRRMRNHVRTARTKGVLGDLGAFGGLFLLPTGYSQPVLVSSTDGVGTKVMVAAGMNRYDTVGQDLVNHSVNDILVQGACPLFFMDYYATGKLDPLVAEQIVKGLAKACRENQCALLGGETAEMPGVYQAEDFDLAGTIVGIVEKKSVIDGQRIRPGDVLLGLPSNGLHTNGYSLVRQILFRKMGYNLKTFIPEFSLGLGEELLKVHRSYLKIVQSLLKKIRIKGLAHITGGGWLENIPRILPSDCQALVEKGSWPILPIFKYLQDVGQLDEVTMYRTFNMGIGMVIVVSRSEADQAVQVVKTLRETVYPVGEIVKGPKGVRLV